MIEKEEFAQRVVRMQGSLYRVAASYLRGESDRLDAISEAIAKAWEKRWTLRDARLFETWLIRILIRESVNIQRRQKRCVCIESIPEQAHEEESERISALRAALDELPQQQRTMVVLHYMEGYSTREISKIMKTTNGAVCSGLSRARAQLRKMIEEEEL